MLALEGGFTLGRRGSLFFWLLFLQIWRFHDYCTSSKPGWIDFLLRRGCLCYFLSVRLGFWRWIYILRFLRGVWGHVETLVDCLSLGFIASALLVSAARRGQRRRSVREGDEAELYISHAESLSETRRGSAGETFRSFQRRDASGLVSLFKECLDEISDSLNQLIWVEMFHEFEGAASNPHILVWLTFGVELLFLFLILKSWVKQSNTFSIARVSLASSSLSAGCLQPRTWTGFAHLPSYHTYQITFCTLSPARWAHRTANQWLAATSPSGLLLWSHFSEPSQLDDAISQKSDCPLPAAF